MGTRSRLVGDGMALFLRASAAVPIPSRDRPLGPFSECPTIRSEREFKAIPRREGFSSKHQSENVNCP